MFGDWAVKTYAHQYPSMAHVAKQYLLVPTTSGQSEYDYQFLTGFKKSIISYRKIGLYSPKK